MAQQKCCQSGSGRHASLKGRILASVQQYAKHDNCNRISIRHLFTKSASQWIIGCSNRSKGSLVYIGRPAINLQIIEPANCVQMNTSDMHSSTFLDRFPAIDDKNCKVLSQSSGLLGQLERSSPKVTTHLSSCPALKRVIYEVHLHVCGSSTSSVMRALLTRNSLNKNEAQDYLSKLL